MIQIHLNNTIKEEPQGGSSYILKVLVKFPDGNVKPYIINRNDSWIDSIIGTPEYIEWFEIPKIITRRFLLKSNKIEQLETINLSNTDHKDQKELNEIKKRYCENFHISKEENRLCDIGIEENIRDKKKKIKEAKEKIIYEFLDMVCQGKVFPILYDFYLHTSYYKDKLTIPRFTIYKQEIEGHSLFTSHEHYVVFMVLKDDWNQFLDKFIKDLNGYCWGWWNNNKNFWRVFNVVESNYKYNLGQLFSYWYDFKIPKKSGEKWINLISRPSNYKTRPLTKEIKLFNSNPSDYRFNPYSDIVRGLYDLIDFDKEGAPVKRFNDI